ncbi:MAG: hypothetical protein PHG49_03055 [Candidatus Pacebacteria bacterium]|nr:hypothetical protein [Candidatus Paceibacterota bacterium]
MEIIKRKTKQCLDCSYYKGYVIEKYNGKVPVICYCTLRNANIKKPNPVIIGYPDGNLYWKPISDHIGKDGQL